MISFPATKELCNSYSAVQNELKNTGLVQSCGFADSPLLQVSYTTNPWVWNGKDPDEEVSVCFTFVSDGLIDAAGIKLVDGVDIDPSKKDSEGGTGVLINEALAKLMGPEGRVGGKIGQSESNKMRLWVS